MIDFRKNKKTIIMTLLSFAIFLIIAYAVLILLRPKTFDGVRQAAYLYSQPVNTIDVAFMGTSHVHCDINTKVLWEQSGIAAYDYSAAEQPLWLTYYYMQELCRYQKPELIVLDMFGPARFTDDYQYRWLPDNLNGVRFGKNKLKMALVGCEREKLSDYFPSINNFHGRYDEIGREDIKELFVSYKEKTAYKGYTPYYVVAPQEMPTFDTGEVGALTEKSELYLHKIIEYARDNGIELCFIVVPYTITSKDQMVYNRIEEIAKEENIRFINYNEQYEEIGIDFDTDFSDYSHLNYYGGLKLSEYIANDIKEYYDIADRRGEKRWESWNRQDYSVDRSDKGK